jgi:hypothetical protein
MKTPIKVTSEIAGRPAIAVALRNNEFIGFGIAIKNPEDTMNWELAETIAVGRAKKRLLHIYPASRTLRIYTNSCAICTDGKSNYFRSKEVIMSLLLEFVRERTRNLPKEINMPPLAPPKPSIPIATDPVITFENDAFIARATTDS